MGGLISVIIPVYNVEDYFSQCMDSVLSQSYEKLEIIVVDDGSIDGSGKMCDDYASKDSRVRVIHRENGGQSVARNSGMEVATGDFISFVDSDDVLHPDYFKVLMGLMTSADVDISSVGMVRFSDKPDFLMRHICNPSTKIMTGEEAMESILYQNMLDASPCCKLFKKKVIENLRFPEGIIYEDLALIYRIYEQSRKVIHCKSEYYFYRMHSGSTTGNFSLRRADVLDVTDEIVAYIGTHHPQLLPAAKDRKFSANMNILMLMTRRGISSPELIARCWSNIRLLRWKSMSNSKVRLKNRVGAMMTLPGLKFLKFIFRLTK